MLWLKWFLRHITQWRFTLTSEREKKKKQIQEKLFKIIQYSAKSHIQEILFCQHDKALQKMGNWISSIQHDIMLSINDTTACFELVEADV